MNNDKPQADLTRIAEQLKHISKHQDVHVANANAAAAQPKSHMPKFLLIHMYHAFNRNYGRPFVSNPRIFMLKNLQQRVLLSVAFPDPLDRPYVVKVNGKLCRDVTLSAEGLEVRDPALADTTKPSVDVILGFNPAVVRSSRSLGMSVASGNKILNIPWAHVSQAAH